jgi:hypothetical protein
MPFVSLALKEIHLHPFEKTKTKKKKNFLIKKLYYWSSKCFDCAVSDEEKQQKKKEAHIPEAIDIRLNMYIDMTLTQNNLFCNRFFLLYDNMWLPMVLDIQHRQDNVHANMCPSHIIKIVHRLVMNNLYK